MVALTDWVFLKCYILIYRKGDSKELKKPTKYIINKNDFDLSGR